MTQHRSANGNSLLQRVGQSTGGALASTREQTGKLAQELEHRPSRLYRAP